MENLNNTEVTRFLVEVVSYLVDDVEPETTDLGGVLLIDLKTRTPEILIGKDGQIIQSLQDLTYAYFQKIKPTDYAFFVVEVADYRRRYLDYYLKLLFEGIDKVINHNETYGLPPMNSFLRKIVHSIISHKYSDQVATESIGEGQNRRVFLKNAN